MSTITIPAESVTRLESTDKSFKRFIYDKGSGSHHYIYLGRLRDGVSFTHAALRLCGPGETYFPKCVGFDSVAGVLWYEPTEGEKGTL